MTRATAGVAAPEQTPALDIRFDFEVVDRFLAFQARGEVGPDELDRWIRLQGNRQLLRRGRNGAAVPEEALKTAVRTAVRGESFPGAGGLGRIDVGSWDVLREMTASIRGREDELIENVRRSLAPYLPGGRTLPPMRVFFHLGGSWDGRSADHVYINLTYFQERGLASLPGLDALLVHELYHRVQASLLASIDDYTSRYSALLTLMMRIQREGMARHLEFLYLKKEFPESELDRTNFDKYRNGLNGAPDQSGVLQEILDRIADGRRLEARRLTDLAANRGGPLYAIGHSMANAIDLNLGAAALGRTAADGPIAFFEAYGRAVGVAGQTSILPARFRDWVAELAGEGYRDAWMIAFLKRRIGLSALQRGELDTAVEAFSEAVRLDRSDAVSAYNLACAYALETGRREVLPWRPTELDRYAAACSARAALRWLDEALRRGFDDFRLIGVDRDLSTLRDDPGFRAILESHGVRGLPGGDTAEDDPETAP